MNHETTTESEVIDGWVKTTVTSWVEQPDRVEELTKRKAQLEASLANTENQKTSIIDEIEAVNEELESYE